MSVKKDRSPVPTHIDPVLSALFAIADPEAASTYRERLYKEGLLDKAKLQECDDTMTMLTAPTKLGGIAMTEEDAAAFCSALFDAGRLSRLSTRARAHGASSADDDCFGAPEALRPDEAENP